MPNGAFQVLDGCSDATARRAREAASRLPGLVLHLVEREPGGVGVARRAGTDLACDRLLSVGRPEEFDRIAAVTGQPTRWLAPRGSLR
ncbi:MAG: hypothetical protein MSC31_15460 [Solirubrobacteraceae bacterium MAG38_C4-C5]|nr:hypothetical protein [Candidatus Siliceabacter maunaloa]